MNNEKDKSLLWEEVSTEHIVCNEWIDFRSSAYRMPDGKVLKPFYSYSRKDYVVVVAFDEDGFFRLCFHRIHRIGEVRVLSLRINLEGLGRMVLELHFDKRDPVTAGIHIHDHCIKVRLAMCYFDLAFVLLTLVFGSDNTFPVFLRLHLAALGNGSNFLVGARPLDLTLGTDKTVLEGIAFIQSLRLYLQ